MSGACNSWVTSGAQQGCCGGLFSKVVSIHTLQQNEAMGFDILTKGAQMSTILVGLKKDR